MGQESGLIIFIQGSGRPFKGPCAEGALPRMKERLPAEQALSAVTELQAEES